MTNLAFLDEWELVQQFSFWHDLRIFCGLGGQTESVSTVYPRPWHCLQDRLGFQHPSVYAKMRIAVALRRTVQERQVLHSLNGAYVISAKQPSS